MDSININSPHYSGLNQVLKEIWRIANSDEITSDEAVFYNENLYKIQHYYKVNAEFWEQQLPIAYGNKHIKK